MSNPFEIEICCYSVDSVLQAAKGGANRVELCDSIQDGGTTPSIGTISLARAIPGIDIYVIIRPRGGDFCYSKTAFETMKYDILAAKKQNVHGIVAGILKPDGNIDIERMKEMKDLAGDTDLTMHRAFDMTCDPFKAIDDLVSLGIKRVLSSGTYNTAIEGVDTLKKLITYAHGRLEFMAGSAHV